ncbi:hypothetical protein ABK040_011628 [Willaertia magna]
MQKKNYTLLLAVGIVLSAFLFFYVSFYSSLFRLEKTTKNSENNLANNTINITSLNNFQTNSKTNKILTKEYYVHFVNNLLLSSGEDFLNNSTYLNQLFSHKIDSSKHSYSRIKVHNTYIHQHRETFLLENVCLNHKGELLFYTSNYLYDNWLNTFSRSLGSVQAWSSCKRGPITLKFVFDKLPLIQNNERIKWYDTPTLMMVRYAAGNVGHHIADSMVAMHETIQKFELNPNDVSVLYLDEVRYRDDDRADGSCTWGSCHLYVENPKTGNKYWCVEELANYGYNKNNTIRFSLQLTQLFSKQPILQRCSYTSNDGKLLFRIEKAPCPMDDIPRYQRETLIKRNFNELADDINVCFKKIIFGVADRAMITGLDFSKFRELGVMGLRKQILSNLDLYEKATNYDIREKVVIGIHVKPLTGRHGNVIFNAKEILSHLEKQNWKERFPLVKEFEFVPIVLEDMNIIEQIELFSSLNIYISTIGSGSIYSLFMPDDSYLIYSPDCKSNNGDSKSFKCHQPIAYFHNNLVHISIFDATPLVTECHSTKDADHCNPVLDIVKIEQKVTQALTMRLLNL